MGYGLARQSSGPMLPFGDVGLTASKPEPRLHRPSIQTYLRNHDGKPPSMRCTEGRKFIRALKVTSKGACLQACLRVRFLAAGNGMEGVSSPHCGFVHGAKRLVVLRWAQGQPRQRHGRTMDGDVKGARCSAWRFAGPHKGELKTNGVERAREKD